MTDTETLSAEEKAYFDTRGETVPADEPEKTTGTDEVGKEPADDDAGRNDIEVGIDDAGEDDGSSELESEKKDRPNGQSKVPLAALTKTREELKAERQAKAALEAEAKVLRERWDQLLASQNTAKGEVEQPKAPKAKEDPLGALERIETRLEQQDREAKEAAERAEQERRANEAWSETVAVAQKQYREAADEDATFEPLYNAVRQSIVREYVDLYGLTEQQAIAEANQFEAQQVAFAAQTGQNVADRLRALARVRGVEAPKPVEASPEKDLERIERGVSGSTSLSAATGGRTATVTRETIANMNAEEFAAWLSKNGQAGFKKLAGG